MASQLLQSLPNMSLAISAAVIACMAISFAVLFFLYGRAKTRAIKFGVEDANITSGLITDLKKSKQKSYAQMLCERKKKERIFKILTDVLFIVIILSVGALTIFSMVLRAKGEQVFLGDSAYITVLTPSMEDKNADNAYLKDNDDGVRIQQYALIGINKVDPAELKTGNIIAFKYDENTVFVHRIIDIREVDGKRLFTTMGDNNSISAENETNITEDRIVGVYSGFHAGFLGVLLIYMRSSIGIVGLIFAFLLLAVIDFTSTIITRATEKRQKQLAYELDGKDTTSSQNNDFSYDGGYDYDSNITSETVNADVNIFDQDGGYDYDHTHNESMNANTDKQDGGNDVDGNNTRYKNMIGLDDDGFEPSDGFSDYADVDDFFGSGGGQ